MFRISLTRKIMILFFIIGVSALSIIGVYSYYKSKQAILKRTLDQLTSIRVIKKGQIESFFNERFNNVLLMANSDYIRNVLMSLNESGNDNNGHGDSGSFYLKQTGEKIFTNLFGFNNLFLLFEDNNNNLRFFSVHDTLALNGVSDSVIKKLLNETWTKSYKTDDIVITDFTIRFKNDEEPVCLIGRKVKDNYGKVLGVLALQIPLREINHIMLENSKENGLGNSGEVYLVGPDYLMRSNSRFIKNSVLRISVNTISAKNAFKNKIGSAIIDDYRTIAVLSSYDKVNIRGLNWTIMAEIDYDEAMIPIVSIRNDILFLSILICALLFSAAQMISRMITQPIIKLKNATVKIGEGNFNLNLTQTSNDEIGLLTDAFNKMSIQLKEEKLKRMSALFDGQELERQRIARELHDSLGQKLVAVKLMIECSSKQCNEIAKKSLDEVTSSCSEAINEIHEISNNLVPQILKSSGIDSAIKTLCESIQHSSNIDVDFSAYGDLTIDDEKTKIYIFRIAQEGLNNAVKHSNATRIYIQLIGNRENLIMIIEDNGEGFNSNTLTENSGTGLYNMKERAQLIGANFGIESEIDHGATIRLVVPKNNTPQQ